MASSYGNKFHLQALGVCITLALGHITPWAYADNNGVRFSTDILDVNDRKNIDLSQFSRSGYIMPGSYGMVVHMNKTELPEQEVTFYATEGDSQGSEACITRALVEQLALKPDVVKQLIWWRGGECLSPDSLKGMEAHGDLETSSLYLSVPQAYLEYSSASWDPPSRWDEGIPGLLLDYNVNAQTQRQQQPSENSYRLSGNGVVGANMGAWRLRANWQGNLRHNTGSGQPTEKQLDWNRYYAYRAIPSMRARLTMGEDLLISDIFDSFQFIGASLVSDDNMLPPNLRGYAPEIRGIAKTNAKVTISQQGRVLYETQVPAGPFRIQDINDAVSGELNVRIEELDGSVQGFTMNTSSIPYLTRPGLVRYKFSTGKPSDWEHHFRGPMFGMGEFSWGITNGWSLYGGALAGGDYNAISLGMGRDLLMLGALSFDVTQSRTRLPDEDGILSGGSYRVNYSKSFKDYGSKVTLAGYRFSQKEYMSMGEYLDARYYGIRVRNNKEMYSVSISQQFEDTGLSAYLYYNHQTYWDQPANDRYTLTLSRYFDFRTFKNMSLSLSAYRNQYNGTKDDGAYLSLSIPWGNTSTISYGTTVNKDETMQRVGYYGRIDENNNYQLSAGASNRGVNTSGYYTHEGDAARLTANANYQEGSYSAVGLSAQGGITLTNQGGALHRVGMMGGARMLLDTEGVKDVPVRGHGAISRTNTWGKAVVGDVSSYYRNSASIDLDKLGDNAEATKSVVQATLTEGAIGYRKFGVIAGEKAMAVIKMVDGSSPPFGATVLNARNQETGIVNDDGNVYLSGINGSDDMTVHWNGQAQCEVRLPELLPADMMDSLLLPCQLLGRKQSVPPVESVGISP